MTTQVRNALSRVINFLDELEKHKIAYRLDHVRDSIMIIASVPGEYWEIEFFEDGHVEIERFESSGVIDTDEATEKALDSLFVQFGDSD